MIWTDRSVILKPISKLTEQAERSSCITSAKPKIKGLSLSKDISTKCNKSVQFIKLTHRGNHKNIERREIKLLVKVKGWQLEDKREMNMSSMFNFDRKGQDQENLSFKINVDKPKLQCIKSNKNGTFIIANQSKKSKQTKNAYMNLHLNSTRVPIVRIL